VIEQLRRPAIIHTYGQFSREFGQLSTLETENNISTPGVASEDWIYPGVDGSLLDGMVTGLNYWQLLKLLEATETYQCQDARDKVHALLGLFVLPLPRVLASDHSISVSQL